MEPTMMTDHSMSSDHMGHDHGSDDAMGNTTTAGTGMGEPFCNGDGTVMLMGFQVSQPPPLSRAELRSSCVWRGCEPVQRYT